jgi:hypothetical protein
MSFIYAKMNTPDMSPWTPENIAIIAAIPGVLATSTEGENNSCVCAKLGGDVPAAKKIVKSMAKAFPGQSVTWSP